MDQSRIARGRMREQFEIDRDEAQNFSPHRGFPPTFTVKIPEAHLRSPVEHLPVEIIGNVVLDQTCD